MDRKDENDSDSTFDDDDYIETPSASLFANPREVSFPTERKLDVNSMPGPDVGEPWHEYNGSMRLQDTPVASQHTLTIEAPRQQIVLKKTKQVCPKGHELQKFTTPRDGSHGCDKCQKWVLEKGTNMFGCRICNWDKCENCSDSKVKVKPSKPAKQKKHAQAGKNNLGRVKGSTRCREYLCPKCHTWCNSYDQFLRTHKNTKACNKEAGRLSNQDIDVEKSLFFSRIPLSLSKSAIEKLLANELRTVDVEIALKRKGCELAIYLQMGWRCQSAVVTVVSSRRQRRDTPARDRVLRKYGGESPSSKIRVQGRHWLNEDANGNYVVQKKDLEVSEEQYGELELEVKPYTHKAPPSKRRGKKQ